MTWSSTSPTISTRFCSDAIYGPAALGIYGRAYELINLPTRIINTAIGVVAFSSLARLQGEPARLKSYFLKGYSLVVSITLPATIACAVFADDIILVTLGPKWTEAATIFRLLAPTILVFGMINPIGWLLQSIGTAGAELENRARVVPAGDLLIPHWAALWSERCRACLFHHDGFVAGAAHLLVLCTARTSRFVSSFRPPVERFSAGIVAAVAAAIVQHFAAPIPSALLRLALGGTAMLSVYVLVLLFVMKQSVFYFGLLRELRRAS